MVSALSVGTAEVRGWGGRGGLVLFAAGSEATRCSQGWKDGGNGDVCRFTRSPQTARSPSRRVAGAQYDVIRAEQRYPLRSDAGGGGRWRRPPGACKQAAACMRRPRCQDAGLITINTTAWRHSHRCPVGGAQQLPAAAWRLGPPSDATASAPSRPAPPACAAAAEARSSAPLWSVGTCWTMLQHRACVLLPPGPARSGSAAGAAALLVPSGRTRCAAWQGRPLRSASSASACNRVPHSLIVLVMPPGRRAAACAAPSPPQQAGCPPASWACMHACALPR